MDVNLDIVWRNSRERFAITDHCIGNAGHGDMMASSSPPLSVKLIAILYACTMPIVVLKTWAALGDLYARQSVGGWVSLLFHVLLIGFYFYLVNGLWKLRELARRIAIGYEAYVVLFGLISVLQVAVFSETRTGSVLAILIWNVVISSAVFWILLTRKAVFK